MKANELRIGNLVYESYSGDLVVDGISINYLDAGKPNGIRGRYDIDSLTPIPLTEEWLKRFGCLPNDTDDNGNINYWNKEKDFSVDMELFRTSTGIESIFYYVICSNRKKQITFVHQLQNLYFALTGEELTPK